MKNFSYWEIAAMLAVLVAALVAVLSVWGVVDGVLALRIYSTLAIVALTATLIKVQIAGRGIQWRP